MSTEVVPQEVLVAADDLSLPAVLTLPHDARGIVVFAHGSGSSRRSPRNQAVAAGLVAQGCGTLLLDLLTEQEAADRRNVFDIAHLGKRVLGASRWLGVQPATRSYSIGLFGASTGAAAALVAAAHPDAMVSAVVSRGGRPDLADEDLPAVTAPTLLIVGSRDEDVLQFNRDAQARLTCTSRLEVVDGATHLFEEPGALEQVALLAGSWFSDWLG